MNGRWVMDNLEQAGLMTTSERERINSYIAAELLSIADSYDQWHIEAVAAIRDGSYRRSGLVQASAVRDHLRAIALDELRPR